ncbi:oxidoreductase [Dactylonectria macrodidyma]|uniref:Oxidoreductase n=1 Tax=Dactylonectria macrodidyma TaxID=307937 RepID=A0A9P9EGI2_9HYPO|nr:oxidoreductase [Dactylonectria macrodidyma]
MTHGLATLFTRPQVRQHASRKSCWIIIDKTVYDITEFVDSHPGGSKLLLNYGGRDATEPFEQLHSAGTLEKYLTPQQVELIRPMIHELTRHDSQMLGSVEATEPSTKAEAQVAQPRKVRLSSVLSIQDFEIAASKILPPRSFAFFKSGAEDEYGYNWNLDSWKTVRLRPRILRPISVVDTSCSLLGTRWSAPFFICPAGGGKIANPAGEVLLTKAAAKHNVLHWVCNNASCSKREIADVRAQNQTLYWQIYAKSDLRESEKEVREAIELGYKGFALTVDAVRAGIRERDLRVKSDEQLADDTSAEGESESESESDEANDFANGQTVKRPPVWTEFSWDSAVEWLRGLTDLPIAIKGIQCWEDAALCMQYEGVHPWLSNHGGRQLDTAPSAIDTLADIQKHCPHLCVKREVIIDGGVTRGADIVKALALGARGVGLGRPFLYALVLGEAGVSKALRILKYEVETTMALLGATSLHQLNPSQVDTSGLAKGVIYLKARI